MQSRKKYNIYSVGNHLARKDSPTLQECGQDREKDTDPRRRHPRRLRAEEEDGGDNEQVFEMF